MGRHGASLQYKLASDALALQFRLIFDLHLSTFSPSDLLFLLSPFYFLIVCGIAGIVGSQLSRDDLEKVLCAFKDSLQHRGPDDQGHFISPRGDAGLVNTRLAILDLSPAGHQPMTSRDGRYTIVFNGDIYNYGALRPDLLGNGSSLRSQRYPEVVLWLASG